MKRISNAYSMGLLVLAVSLAILTSWFLHTKMEVALFILICVNMFGAFLLYSKILPYIRKSIATKKEAREILSYQANYDALTGLANRSQFQHYMDAAISSAKRYSNSFAVLFLDIDYFKRINDTLGHDAGDELLKLMGERLKSNIRKSDIAARLGGDEFVIILQGAQHVDTAAIFADKILNTFRSPITIKGNELFITTSIGISFYGTDGTDSESLLKSADLALYAAKENGRNNYQFCTPELNNRIKEKALFKAALLQAFKHQEFKLVFLPKMDVKLNRIIGFEALLRWESSAYGNVSPDKIIATADEMGMTADLGNWVIKQACLQAKTWSKSSAFLKKVTINISSKHFANPNLVDAIASVLNDIDLPGKYLDLEITESVIMKDPEYSLKIIHDLRIHDIEVTIDNFGTGYSSIKYLQQFSVNRVKADRTFTKEVAMNSDQTRLLRVMIGLARNLNLKIQVEGVETAEQYTALLEMGVDEIQGYYISEPIATENVVGFLRTTEDQLVDA